MTSLRQIESNRRNALKSTGPKTDLGKQRTCRNAVRHGLTAETVILPLENAEDYKAFEVAVTSTYEAETAVERELVLRLASLLWRLRRTTLIETQLFQMEGDVPRATKQNCPILNHSKTEVIFGSACSGTLAPSRKLTEVAQYFLRITDLDNAVFDRLGRYEAALWRQVRQTVLTLEGPRWRTPKARFSRRPGPASFSRNRWDRA